MKLNKISLKEMIIMANSICQYCESTLNREKSSNITVGEKAMLVGGSVLFAIALGAFILYEASQGIYVDLNSLS